MKRPNFETIEEIADATASGLAQVAAHSAFHLFNDKEFRRLARFDQLSQVEHDRIFNELVVAELVLIMLIIEAPDLRVDRDFRSYLSELHERIPKAYVGQLKELGVETDHLKDWEKLTELRYEEYARGRHDVRAAAMQIESDEKDLDLDGLARIQLTVPLQAVAIGCHHHICRGKTDGRDDLFKFTLKSLSKFYLTIRIRLEGGKITLVKQARMALRRIFRRIRRGYHSR